jgi:hypothetical protein
MEEEQELDAQGQDESGNEEGEEVQIAPPEHKEPSFVIWTLLGILAVIVDGVCIVLDFVYGAGFILDSFIKPLPIFFFKWVLKKSGIGAHDPSVLKKFSKIANILGFTSVIPFVSSLPQCIAILLIAYSMNKAKKAIKKIAPVAREIEKVAHYAKYIPGLQEAAVVEAGAAGVAKTGEAMEQGKSAGEAVTEGGKEALSKGVGSFAPGGAGAVGSVAGASAGEASKAVGVGSKYMAGASQDQTKIAGEAVSKKSIFEQVKERADQEGTPYAEGQPIQTEGLYADVKKDEPTKKASEGRKTMRPRELAER